MTWHDTRTWTDDLVEHTAALYNLYLRDNLNFGVRRLAVLGARELAGETLTETDLLGTVAAGASATDPATPVTLPAGQLGTRGMLRLTATGLFYNDSGADAQLGLTLKLGGNTIYQDTTLGLSGAFPQAHAWRLMVCIAAISNPAEKFCAGFLTLGASGATIGTGDLNNATESPSDGPMTYPIGSDGLFSVDTATADAALELLMTNTSINAGAADLDKLSLTREWACVELIGQAS